MTMRPNRPAVLYILNMILMVESMTTSGIGTNLRGRMFTLSKGGGGGVSLYPPSFNPSSPSPSRTPYTTSYWPWPTAATTAATSTLPATTLPPSTPLTSTLPATRLPPTTLPATTLPPSTPSTTASPRGGVSVCVRYMVEVNFGYPDPIFTLSMNSSMTLSTDSYGTHLLTLRTLDSSVYSELSFKANRQLWPYISDLWTSVCVAVDSRKGVAQVFRGGAMSIGKQLPTQYYEWTGAPVIDLSNIDGQLTDVQVWSSCLTTDDVYSYMTYASRGPYRGSVLTWFDISYSLRGNALLDEALYAMEGPISQRAVQPIRGQAREPARLIEKRRKRLFRKRGRKDRKREWDVSRMRDEGYLIRSSLVFVQ